MFVSDRKMKTRVALAVAAAAVGGSALAAPYFIGEGVEKDVRTAADAANSNPYFQSWEVAEYDRGWGSSTAVSEVELVVPGTDNELELAVEHDITHGPFLTGGQLAAIDSTVEVTGGGVLAHQLDREFEEGIPLNVDTVIALGGDTTIDVTWDAEDQRWSSPIGRFFTQGAEGRIHLSEDASAVEYTIETDSFSYKTPGASTSVKFKPVTITGGLQLDEETGYWVGESSLSVDQIKKKPYQRRTIFEMSDIDVTSTTTVEEGALSFDMAVNLQPYVLGGGDIKDFQWEFGVDRISAQAIEDLAAAADRFEMTATPRERQLRAREAFQRIDWGEFAHHDPMVRIDKLEANAPTGMIELQAQAGLKGADEDFSANDMRDLARYAQADASISVPKELALEQAVNALEMRTGRSEVWVKHEVGKRFEELKRRGVLEVEGAQVMVDLSYGADGIRINGEPVAHYDS